jgi:predicted DCC family thiol-disulfide oxidoreductase YuxK
MSAAVQSQPLPERIVLFDGVCLFCDAAIDWLAARDPHGRFQFAALQGDTASLLRARHAEIPGALETMVLVERSGGVERVYRDSQAVFRVLEQLESPWRHAALLRFLPRVITDFAYRLFARNRYRMFGRRDRCRIPTPEERRRFLS